MKYLGIELKPDIKEIIFTNMESLLDKIKVNLDNCSRLHLTLWGKVNIIKMVIAPKINYLILYKYDTYICPTPIAIEI